MSLNFFNHSNRYIWSKIKSYKSAYKQQSLASSVLPDAPEAFSFNFCCVFLFSFSHGYSMSLNNMLILLKISYHKLFILTLCYDGGGFFSFSSLWSSSPSYQNGGFIILGPSANLISNFKVKPPFLPSNTDINSYHPFCKTRIF